MGNKFEINNDGSIELTQQSEPGVSPPGKGVLYHDSNGNLKFSNDGNPYRDLLQIETMDYIEGRLSINQASDLSSGNHVKFDIKVSGNIELDTTSGYSTDAGSASVGRISLKAGKTYFLDGNLGEVGLSNNGANFVFAWYSTKAGTETQLGTSGNVLGPGYTGNASQFNAHAQAIYTPTEDILVELRLLGSSFNYISSSPSYGAGFRIFQIGTTGLNVGDLEIKQSRALIPNGEKYIPETKKFRDSMWVSHGEGSNTISSSEVVFKVNDNSEALRVGTYLLAKYLEYFNSLENDTTWDQINNKNLISNFSPSTYTRGADLIPTTLFDGADMPSESAPLLAHQHHRIVIGTNGTDSWYMDVFLSTTATGTSSHYARVYVYNFNTNTWANTEGSLDSTSFITSTTGDITTTPFGSQSGVAELLMLVPIELELN